MRLLRNGNLVVDPWREIANLQREVNRLFSGVPQAATLREREFPLINLFANEDCAILTAELPGIDVDKLDISVHGDTVTLKGEVPAQQVPQGSAFHRRERPAGTFVRTLALPFEVNADATEAVYEKGVLTLKLARPEVHKPKKVLVKAV